MADYSCNRKTQTDDKKQFDDTKFHLEKWKYYSEKVADCQMSQKFELKIAARVQKMATGRFLLCFMDCTSQHIYCE
eukprot:SAG31_NODE_3222_length_4523_cov_2.551085_5_plen_76_part_00